MECVICGQKTTRSTTEEVTGVGLTVGCHRRCENKAKINSMYGASYGIQANGAFDL